MKQGQNKPDDNYLNRFNSCLKNLELAGDEHSEVPRSWEKIFL